MSNTTVAISESAVIREKKVSLSSIGKRPVWKTRQGVFVCANNEWTPTDTDSRCGDTRVACGRHGCLYRGLRRAYRQASLRDTSADLQLLALNVCVRRRYDNSLRRTSFGNLLNCPRPAKVAILVEGPSCTSAFPNLHSPVIAVGRNCENKCNCGGDDHSAQRSDQKYASHFSNKLTSVGLLPLLRVRQILPSHSRAVPCSLFCTSTVPAFPLY